MYDKYVLQKNSRLVITKKKKILVYFVNERKK